MPVTRQVFAGVSGSPASVNALRHAAGLATSHPAGTLRGELLRIAGQALLRPVGRQLS
jgi:hypothetical protein